MPRSGQLAARDPRASSGLPIGKWSTWRGRAPARRVLPPGIPPPLIAARRSWPRLSCFGLGGEVRSRGRETTVTWKDFASIARPARDRSSGLCGARTRSGSGRLSPSLGRRQLERDQLRSEPWVDSVEVSAVERAGGVFTAKRYKPMTSSPERIRTAVAGSKGQHAWPLHHGAVGIGPRATYKSLQRSWTPGRGAEHRIHGGLRTGVSGIPPSPGFS